VREQCRVVGALGTFGPDDSLVVQQAARRKRVEVLQPVLGQGAIDAVAGVENPALRVAE
jgi:hypothetical protein